MSQEKSPDYRAIAQTLTRSLKKRPDVVGVVLFGAGQRGQTWENSDVDLLVVTDEAPPVAESYAERSGVTVHLHWQSSAALDAALTATGDARLHAMLGAGEVLFDRDGTLAAWAERLHPFPDEYRRQHLLPHLEAMAGWARDLRKRMARRDERPRRAAARQWEVDNHSASVLLIEKGQYPHNEPTTQALEHRIFVPNLADPDEIEGFVTPRAEQWLLPLLRDDAAEPFDAASLHGDTGLPLLPLLLELGVKQGWLRSTKSSDRSTVGIQERMYRLA